MLLPRPPAPGSSSNTEPPPEPFSGQPTATQNASFNAPCNTNRITEIRPKSPKKNPMTSRHEQAGHEGDNGYGEFCLTLTMTHIATG